MNLRGLIENLLLEAADLLYRRLPQPMPDFSKFDRCKLISHRGDHDNHHILENTIPAFEAAVAGGVWGVEFDVRWTKDLEPVVIHDRDTRRVFGSSQYVQNVTLRELRRTHPLIPHLEEVVDRFSGYVHLMVELKDERYPGPDIQQRCLENIFSRLVPQKDFHFISLVPRLFDHTRFMPKQALLPIAQTNIRAMSELAFSKRLGGLLGHYLLLTNTIMEKHRKRQQITGTGFINSRYCLFRELNRGVAMIFSNRASAMQSIVNSCVFKA
jgi:glycerophosphoryl diester phosphodiesterase